MVDRKQARLNEQEASEVVRLRAPVVYTAIKKEGEDELSRPVVSLWWSGVGAGLAIFLSVIATGTLTYHLGGEGHGNPIVHLGYTLGFLAVILGRLQLFTENTITAVIPLLSNWNKTTLFQTLRLWVVVFMANMAGVMLAALATVYGDVFSAEIKEGIVAISRHYVDRTALEFFLQGIPAGFIVGALVWMLPSSHGSEFWVIVAMTFLISAAGLTHVVAGSGEVFVMLLLGEVSWQFSLLSSILPTFAGNVIGGTALFTLLAYGQVYSET